MSAVKWAAKKNTIKKSSRTKTGAKPMMIPDDRPSQKVPLKRDRVAPEWARLKKDDHAKIAGTRLQSLPGGSAVRVVLEDGKKFAPHKVLAAKRHLKKLAEQAKEKAEIARMIGESNAASSATPADVAPAGSKPAVASKEQSNKKARKEAAWKDRQQKLAGEHAARLAEDGRELASAEWLQGEVLQRAQGRVWMKVSDTSKLPERVLLRLREATAEIRSELSIGAGDVVPLRFADLADKTVDLKVGVALHFKVFTDKNGVGGCDAKAAPVSEKASASPSKKRKAADLSEADKTKCQKTGSDVAAEGEAAEAATKAQAAEAAVKAESAAAAAKADAAEAAAKAQAAEAVAKAAEAAEAAAKAQAAEAAAKVEAAESAAKAEADRLAVKATPETPMPPPVPPASVTASAVSPPPSLPPPSPVDAASPSA